MEQARSAQCKPPLTVTLLSCQQALQSRLENAPLWGAVPCQARDGGIPVQFVPGSRLHGWDSVRACKITELNRRIRAANPAPTPFDVQVSDEASSVSAGGRLGCWQIAPGGAGRNLNLTLPIEDCTLQESGRPALRLEGLTAVVQIDLSSLESRPRVFILSLSGGNLRLRDTAWLKLALDGWCREHLDSLLAFSRDIDCFPAGPRRCACLETVEPGGDLVGVLSAEDPSRLPGLQHILPPEAADAVLINQDSAVGRSLLLSLPVFHRFPAGGLEAAGEGLRACGLSVPPPADEHQFPLTVNSFLIKTQPCLQVEMDVSLRLPSGVTVHLTVRSTFEAVLSGKEVRFFAGPSSSLNHRADIPGGGLTEEREREIAQAVEELTARVLY